jgi:four helix bundle protein
MARSNFENLEVYRLSEKLADGIWGVVEHWEPLARATVGKQLIRAADSIGANLAEGVGRGSFQDNRRFVRVARGSLNETKHWLRRAYRRNLLNQETVGLLKTILNELSPRMNSYLKSIGTKRPDANNGQQATDHRQRQPDKLEQRLTTDQSLS